MTNLLKFLDKCVVMNYNDMRFYRYKFAHHGVGHNGK